MTESEFNELADQVFAHVGQALDSSETDVDWDVREGVLEMECPDRSKLILSRHTLNRELWLAARSGGYHYRAEAGTWRDTRGGESLSKTLERALLEQAGCKLTMPPLPVVL